MELSSCLYPDSRLEYVDGKIVCDRDKYAKKVPSPVEGKRIKTNNEIKEFMKIERLLLSSLGIATDCCPVHPVKKKTGKHPIS